MADKVEIRLAIVMNGGVSLAVWMGGVSHEVDLLRRASAGMLPPPPPVQPDAHDDRPVYEAWRALCTKLNVDVTVDVIAGSSAGGLNGTLLATAIARGVPLPGLHDIWRDVAQLAEGQLLWPADQDDAPSILNGTFFQDQVSEVFSDIPMGADTDAKDVTLFVTATAIGNQPRRVVDSNGTVLTTQDHRRLYRFARRPRRIYTGDGGGPVPADLAEMFPVDVDMPQPFDHPLLLARSARASASFPVAFAPVPEAIFEQVPTPSLETFRKMGTGPAWLMDGGVLDNAPFGPVIDEVARTPVDRPWRRALIYVVPSVDHSEQVAQTPEAPGWQRVLANAVMLPREADLRADVEELRQFAQDAERWGSGPQHLFQEVRASDAAGRAGYRSAAKTLFDDYRRSRVDGGITDALWQWAQERPEVPVTLGSLPSGTDGNTGSWAPETPADFEIGDTWRWGTAVADRVLRLMLRDLATRHRQPPVDPALRGPALAALSEVLECVAALRDAVEAHLRNSTPVAPTSRNALDAIDGALSDLHAPSVLAELLRRAAAAYLTAASPGWDDGAPAGVAAGTVDPRVDLLHDALVVEVLTGAFTADKAFNRPVQFDFYRFGPDVSSPLVSVANPNDPNSPMPPGPWKLWGSQLGHFAAFGKPEWRDQDWLWGRLDGAAHLVRLLIAESERIADPTVTAQTIDTEHEVAVLQQAVLAAHGISAEVLTARTSSMADLDGKGVIAAWRADPAGRASLMEVLDSVLRVLRNADGGNDAHVAGLGDLLTVVFGDELPADLHRLRDRVGHTAALRLHLRKWLEGRLFSDEDD